MEIAHAVDIAQLGAHKLLIRLHVARLYLQREVIFTTRIVTLRYLLNALNSLHKIVHQHLRVMLQAHVAEHGDAITRLLRIKDGMIALDEALALQSLLTVEGWRGRQVYPGSQFLDGKRRVVLQDAQYLAVGVVQFVVCHNLPNNILLYRRFTVQR